MSALLEVKNLKVHFPGFTRRAGVLALTGEREFI
jgi:hypothetical protein